jgi:uncharacterized protein (TIGR03435 family)
MNRRQILMAAAASLAVKGQEAQQFEAASIKPSAPAQPGEFRIGVRMLPGGRVSMSGVTAKILIQQAYGVRDFQIIGGPSWMGVDRYDITAKPEGAANPDQVKVMIQGLLAERFQLKFHRETRELPTYALVVGKGGPKIHESEVDKSSEKPRGTQMSVGRGQLDVKSAPMAALTNHLGQVLGRSVIDKTELLGNYDFKLEWTPDDNQGDGGVPADSQRPSIFTAVQDQLGLKLESTKGPVEILVVDRVEKASDN